MTKAIEFNAGFAAKRLSELCNGRVAAVDFEIAMLEDPARLKTLIDGAGITTENSVGVMYQAHGGKQIHNPVEPKQEPGIVLDMG